MALTKSIYGKIADDNRLVIKIINLNTQDEIDIFYTQPESISEPYSANYEEKSIVGRSSPLIIYTGGTKKDVSFTLTFHEDYLVEETDIRKFIDKLRAMSYPVYDGYIKTPKVYVRIGKMYSFWGIINTNPTYKGPVRGGHMIMCDVEFTFTKISNVSPSNFKDYNGEATVDDAYTVRDEWKFGGS